VGFFLRVVTYHFPDPDEHLKELWKMIAFAARYGHQPLGELLLASSVKLSEFNTGVSYWIEKENQSGGGFNRADGGG